MFFNEPPFEDPFDDPNTDPKSAGLHLTGTGNMTVADEPSIQHGRVGFTGTGNVSAGGREEAHGRVGMTGTGIMTAAGTASELVPSLVLLLPMKYFIGYIAGAGVI